MKTTLVALLPCNEVINTRKIGWVERLIVFSRSTMFNRTV